MPYGEIHHGIGPCFDFVFSVFECITGRYIFMISEIDYYSNAGKYFL